MNASVELPDYESADESNSEWHHLSPWNVYHPNEITSYPYLPSPPHFYLSSDGGYSRDSSDSPYSTDDEIYDDQPYPASPTFSYFDDTLGLSPIVSDFTNDPAGFPLSAIGADDDFIDLSMMDQFNPEAWLQFISEIANNVTVYDPSTQDE